MKKLYLNTIGSTLIVGVFIFLAFGSGSKSKPTSDAEFKQMIESDAKLTRTCCVCSGTGKEQASNGYRKCGTCYGVGQLTEGRYNQVCN